MKAANVDFLMQGYAQLELVSDKMKLARLAAALLPKTTSSMRHTKGTRQNKAHL